MIDLAVDIYNHLPHAVEVRVDETLLNAAQRIVAGVIRSYDATPYAALSLSHRHFELDRNAIPVWQVEQGELRLKPSIYDERLHTPIAWRSGGIEVATPIEFAAKKLVSSNLQSHLDSPNFSDFQSQFFAALNQVDTNAQFGLTLTPALFSDFFFSGGEISWPYRLYYEMDGEVGRYMKVIPVSASDIGSMVTIDTTWHVRADGTMQVAMACQCRK